jgi:hypothetical protein
MAEDVRAAAMEVIVAEEWLAGNTPEPIRGTHLEQVHGCDILVGVPGQAEPDRVEVKGWGEPMIAVRGKFSWRQDMQVSQYRSASSGLPFRMEIVANLRRFLDAGDRYDRLTVDADFIRRQAQPSAYEVDLEPLREGIRRHGGIVTNTRLRSADIPPFGAPWMTIAAFALTYPGWCATEWSRDIASQQCADHWHRTGELPTGLERLRLELFWEQRAVRHRDSPNDPDEEMMAFLHAVVERIREIVTGAESGLDLA